MANFMRRTLRPIQNANVRVAVSLARGCDDLGWRIGAVQRLESGSIAAENHIFPLLQRRKICSGLSRREGMSVRKHRVAALQSRAI